VRRDADGGNAAVGGALGANSGSGNNTQWVREEANDEMRPYNGATQGGNALDNFVNGTWRYIVLSRSGADPNGVLKLRWLDGAETSFGEVTMTGLTALAPTGISINCARGDGTGFATEGQYTVAFVKIWSTVELSDADCLTERLYRNIQTNTANDWALYKFLTGALTTDSSGNSRTLTAVGAPEFNADEPAAILGDDPGGGVGIPKVMHHRRMIGAS
jgi:hypothetical protein